MPEKEVDRREEIAIKMGLCTCIDAYKNRGLVAPDCPYHSMAVVEAMDENGRQMCLDLLEYMAKNEYKCYCMEDDDGEPYYFFSKGAGHPNILKEELFENFL